MVFLKCKQCGEEFEWKLNTKYFRHICGKCGQASEYNLDSSAELILESSSNEEQTTEEQTTEEQTLIHCEQGRRPTPKRWCDRINGKPVGQCHKPAQTLSIVI